MYSRADFRGISLNGRVAYGILCFENFLVKLNYCNQEWKEILEDLWSFTNASDIEHWGDIISDIIPNHLLEFDDYDSSDFEILERDRYQKLYNLYIDCDNRIDDLMMMVYNLGMSHIYSSIVGIGEPSLIELETILEFMKSNSIDLPNIKPLKAYSIRKNSGRGVDFEGRKLSKILK